MPPASATQELSYPGRGLEFGLLLGTEYERKKAKLLQELQLDFKQYAAQKTDLKTNKPHVQPQGVSLPINESISVKEKLREERKTEYNAFLREQSQFRLKRGKPVPSKPEDVQAPDAVCNSPRAPILHTNTQPASRKDAATLTESVDHGKDTGTWGPGHRRRRCWYLVQPKQQFSSEDELFTSGEEELEIRHRRRPGRHIPHPEYKGKRRNRVNRSNQDTDEREAPAVQQQNNNESAEQSDLQGQDSMRTAARSRPTTSKDKAEFATGLLIGASEQERVASRRRNEQYKQDLLMQIAEQRKNKIREKKLELRVAATRATDPEKTPDRIKQFGPVNCQYDSWKQHEPHKPGIELETTRQDTNPRPKYDKPPEDTEQRVPPGHFPVDPLTRTTVAGSGRRAAQHVSAPDYFNEDYHRNFLNALGEVAIPRVAGVPPPVPATVSHNYVTPYDDAYHYYGTRNPLYPNLPYNQYDQPWGMQHSGNLSSPQRPAAIRRSSYTEAAEQHRASPIVVGEQTADKSRQRAEHALCYQEELRQQIKEREERRRKEKEEKERYHAKIEAEMMAYNPWGRSGAGAPIKDQQGNLVSDLKQMRRTNEESYRNPVTTHKGQTHRYWMGNGHTPAAETMTLPVNRLSGFSDQPTPQQLHQRDRYKEELKQQIEENKRKQEEEKRLMKIEDEKLERRLEEERARIQRRYEEEQRKEKKTKLMPEKKMWINEAKTQVQEEEKRGRQEEKKEKKLPDRDRDREDNRVQPILAREPSPPVPTLQMKQTHLRSPRPPSAASRLSSRTDRSVSAPHRMQKPQLEDGQQEVIKELSTLRRYLRNKRYRLETELGHAHDQESHYSPPSRPGGRPRVDAFKETVQPSTRSPSSGYARVNMQNIREFNQLRHKDSASREELRHLHPDPPTDAQSLDIQQQALLREQQHKLRRMRREEMPDILDLQLSPHQSSNKPARLLHRDSMLPSETAFIDVYSGDSCEEGAHQQRPPQPWQRTAPRRRHDRDNVAAPWDQDIEPDAQSPHSGTSSNLENKVHSHNRRRTMRLDTFTDDHFGKTEGPPGDEVDVLSLGSALERRVSLDTVATEPWLRPGTSAAVGHRGCRERPNSKMEAPPWLTQRGT